MDKKEPPRGRERLTFDLTAAANYAQREAQKKAQREQAKFDKLKLKPVLKAMTSIPASDMVKK